MLFSVLDARATQYEVYTVSFEYQQSNAIAKYHYIMKSLQSPTHDAHPAVATVVTRGLCELFLCELLQVTVSCPEGVSGMHYFGNDVRLPNRHPKLPIPSKVTMAIPLNLFPPMVLLHMTPKVCVRVCGW